ncbi:MAG: alpha/beta fold hydrolase [Candidatus Micrarchaeota archaeon]
MNKLLVFFAISVLLFGCVQMPGGSTAGQAGGTSGGGAQSGGTAGGTADTGTTSQDSGTQDSSAGQDTGTQDAGTQDSGTSGTQITSLKNREISYSSGAWKIYGTLYDSVDKTPKRAIFLIPMLGEARDSYPISFIEKLHDGFPDSLVVAIDPRGHGKSTNLGTWDDFDTAMFKDMKTDILSLRKYLQPAYPNVETFYAVGASMGSSSAIMAGAQEKTINKLVMISPGIEYQGVDITAGAEDYVHPILMVASTGDDYSESSISQIKTISGRPELETKLYPGTAHGTDLFADTADSSAPLEDVIVEFLK